MRQYSVNVGVESENSMNVGIKNGSIMYAEKKNSKLGLKPRKFIKRGPKVIVSMGQWGLRLDPKKRS